MSSKTRQFWRGVVLSLATITVAPLVLLAWLERRWADGDALFIFGAHCVASAPGKIGEMIRTAYYWKTLDAFPSDALLGLGSFFSKRGARVGGNVSIGAYCVIGLVDIEHHVEIASRVSIISGIHTHGSAAEVVGGKWDDGRFEVVRIGAGSWIGEGAVIGANVGQRAVISAGAVVLSPVPDEVLVMGNPARMVPLSRNTTVR